MKLRTAAAAALVMTLAACGGATSDAGEGKPAASTGAKGTVKLAINPWVGYEANAAVIAHLLKSKLGYQVENKELKEEVSWQGFETGEVDAIVENWGHDDLKKTYIEQKKVAVEAGPTGNKGRIGWFIPQWMADEHPDNRDTIVQYDTTSTALLEELVGLDDRALAYAFSRLAGLPTPSGPLGDLRKRRDTVLGGRLSPTFHREPLAIGIDHEVVHVIIELEGA